MPKMFADDCCTHELIHAKGSLLYLLLLLLMLLSRVVVVPATTVVAVVDTKEAKLLKRLSPQNVPLACHVRRHENKNRFGLTIVASLSIFLSHTHTHTLSLFHASLYFSLIRTHFLTLYRLPSLSLSRNLSFYRSHLSFDLSTSSTDNSKHLPTFLLSLFPSFSLTHTLTHSNAFSHSITTNSSLTSELFSGRRWRFISAQLSNKFGYCLSQTVSG